MFKFIGMLFSKLPVKSQSKLILSAIKGKMSKEERKALVGDSIDALSSDEAQDVLSNTIVKSDGGAKKKFLKLLLAGGKGYLVGGEAGAALAAANVLLEEISKEEK